jgi:glutamyl-tRNA reductase
LLRDLQVGDSDKILVVGAGKFGKSLGRNLRKYFPENPLFFCNRTQSKSEALAEELSCRTVPFGVLPQRADEFDILISAIGDAGFKLTPEHLDIRKEKILIDLSVPSFFDRKLDDAEGIRLFTIQDASCIVNRSLEKRESSIPMARNILFKHIHEFVEWSRIYAKSGYIREWKAKVEEISEACPHFHNMPHEKQNSILRKSVSRFVHYLKQKTTSLEENQPVLNHFIKNEHPSPCLLRCEQKEHPTIHCKLCLRN